MNFSQLLVKTYILIAVNISSLVFILFILVFMIEVLGVNPLMHQLAPIFFLISLLVIFVGLTFGQLRYNKRMKILRAVDTPAQRVIIYRRAVFYRLLTWEISSVIITLFYALTGNSLILLLALCFIPVCASSFADIYLTRSRLLLSDKEISHMVFSVRNRPSRET